MKQIIILSAVLVGLVSCTSRAENNLVPAASDREAFVNVAGQTVNGVVSVKSFATPRRQQQQQYYDPFYEFFYGPRSRRDQPEGQPESRQIGLGSGVVIDADGYIVTNNHVIADAERLEVTLNDNRNYPATVVGADETTDLALIKIEAPDLHVIPVGNSEDLKVGEWVLAVGNPFGFTSTVTAGIVSAKARNISTTTGGGTRGGIESYIQHDAAVNQGNSGGALVNLEGELVGINTAIYSQTGAYAGCSFAIPTSIVEKVVDDLRKYGTVQRAYLGISFRELSPEFIAAEGITGPTSGIYVASIEDRSAALAAGLSKGDIITSVAGHPTRSTAELQEAIARLSPGNEVDIVYWRDGNERTTKATLRNSRGDTALTRPAENGNLLGATFKALDRDTARRLEIGSGVIVDTLDPDGLFAKAGILEGFVIIAVNNQRVQSPEEIEAFAKAINSAQGIDKVLFISGILPSGKVRHYAVALDE